MHLRRRYLSPALGQFVSLDPLEVFNRYAYVNANPVNGVDPDGYCGQPINWLDPVDANCYYSAEGLAIRFSAGNPAKQQELMNYLLTLDWGTLKGYETIASANTLVNDNAIMRPFQESGVAQLAREHPVEIIALAGLGVATGGVGFGVAGPGFIVTTTAVTGLGATAADATSQAANASFTTGRIDYRDVGYGGAVNWGNSTRRGSGAALITAGAYVPTIVAGLPALANPYIGGAVVGAVTNTMAGAGVAMMSDKPVTLENATGDAVVGAGAGLILTTLLRVFRLTPLAMETRNAASVITTLGRGMYSSEKTLGQKIAGGLLRGFVFGSVNAFQGMKAREMKGEAVSWTDEATFNDFVLGFGMSVVNDLGAYRTTSDKDPLKLNRNYGGSATQRNDKMQSYIDNSALTNTNNAGAVAPIIRKLTNRYTMLVD